MRAAVVGFVMAVLAAGEASAQHAQRAATCRADRQGGDLITRIEYPDGYTLEGPWRVTGSRSEKGATASVIAVLDHIIETEAVSRTQQTMRLPGIIEMTFRGNSANEVLDEAASVWCATVIHARRSVPRMSAPREQVADIHITP